MSKYAYILLIPAFLLLAFTPLMMSHKNAAAKASIMQEMEKDHLLYLDLHSNYVYLRMSVDQYLRTGNTNYLTDPTYIQRDLVRVPQPTTNTR